MKTRIFIVVMAILSPALISWSGGSTPPCNFDEAIKYVSVECLPTDYRNGTYGMVFNPPSSCGHTNPGYVWGQSVNTCIDPWASNFEDQLEYIAYAVGPNGQGSPCEFQHRKTLRNSNRLNGILCYSTISCKTISAGGWMLKYPLNVQYKFYLQYNIGCRTINTSPSSTRNVRGFSSSPNYTMPANIPPEGPGPHRDLLEVNQWDGGYECAICTY